MAETIKDWQERIKTRQVPLIAGLAVTAAYALIAGLAFTWAIAGIIGLLLWAALWPVARTAFPVARSPSKPSSPAEMQSTIAAPELWVSILEGIPIASILLERDSTVVAHNSAARDLLSVTAGHHLSSVVRSPDLLAAIERARRTRQQQVAELKFAIPVERLLVASVSPLFDANGLETPRLLIAFRDRTEEQQLAQLRADFVANASHELRTPLASVKGFIETLRGAAKDDPAARDRFLGIMQEQAERMARLIEDLLSLSRIEMREHVPPRDVVDLADVADEVGRSLQPLAEKAGRTITLAISLRPANVRGDRDELAQVAQNLVQNAIKYGRPNGHVRLALNRVGASVSLSVVDDGIGIAPEHVPRLTERFYRVSAKDSRERGGTGLGLAIVKHIVNRHRGDLQITSELGKGSTFTVLLPALETA